MASADLSASSSISILILSPALAPRRVLALAIARTAAREGALLLNYCEALEVLHESLDSKARQWRTTVKSGRTHLMDAVPVTLGQEFGGYAAQIRLGIRRIQNTLPQVAQIPLGGTATGTGLNTHPEFAARVRSKLSEQTGTPIGGEDGKTIMPVAVYCAAMAVQTGAKDSQAALEFLGRYVNADGQKARLAGGGNAVPAVKGIDDIVLEGGLPANAKVFNEVATKGWAIPLPIARSAKVSTNFGRRLR